MVQALSEENVSMSRQIPPQCDDVGPSMANFSEVVATRAMKGLLDLDRLILTLPGLMRGTKAPLFTPHIEEVTNLSTALRLTIHLERSAQDVVQACHQLDVAIRQFALLADRSRMPHGAHLAVRLVRDLSMRLRRDITGGVSS